VKPPLILTSRSTATRQKAARDRRVIYEEVIIIMKNNISFLSAVVITAMSLVITTLTLASNICDTGIIFSKEESINFAVKIPSGKLTPPFWTPETRQVMALEKILPEHIEKNTSKNRKPIRDISTYKRQYLGITHNGKKQIYVNAFCEAHWSRTSEWQSKFVYALGGGNCFFKLRYDPVTNEILNFEINSER
jgi:hypothetical protein